MMGFAGVRIAIDESAPIADEGWSQSEINDT